MLNTILKRGIRDLIARNLARAYAPKPRPGLELGSPVSSQIQTVSSGDSETQLRIDSIGSNRVRHLSDVLLRETRSGSTTLRLFTMRTRMFASYQDSNPSATETATYISSVDLDLPGL